MSSTLGALGGFFGVQAAKVDVSFRDKDTRKKVKVSTDGGKEVEQFLFGATDEVAGTVGLAVPR